MKRKDKRFKKSNNYLIFIILLLFLSFGFAAFSRNLNIFGSSILKGQKFDVHFENVQVSNEGVQIDTPTITDKTTVEYNITLDKPEDFVEFTVDAKNGGTVDAMISSLDQIKICDEVTEEEIEGISEYLDYSVTYVEYEDVPIAVNHLLKAGEKATYTVRIEYKKYVEEETKLKAIFKVEFAQANKNAVPYNQHPVTNSTLSKTRFKSFGKMNTPKKITIVNTGVSDPENEKYVDISEEQDKSILAWMDVDTMYVSAKEKGLYIKAPSDSSYLFGVYNSGSDGWIQNLVVIDASKLDTSKVTNMRYMFYYAGYKEKTFENLGLSEWDTSNVTNMYGMFYSSGYHAIIFELDLSGWDTSSVTDMSWMFRDSGNEATTWSIYGISEWDTSNVTEMKYVFSIAGYNATTFELDLSGWDTSNVTNMNYMFSSSGYHATTLKLNLGSWDTSNVQTMCDMFYETGRYAETFELNLSDWDTSNVTDMDWMFVSAGRNSTVWSIGNISGWDTSNVQKMSYMFSGAGQNADYSLDLSGWDVNKVTSYSGFNKDVEDKVTPPTWVN